MDRRGLVARFVVALLVLAALLAVFGPRTVVESLRRVRPIEALLVLALATVWLVLRAEAMYQTVRVSLPEATRTGCATAFLSGVFVASVLPVGNVGGVVSAAYVLREQVQTTGSAAIGILSAWEVLNVIASVGVALVGVLVVLLPGGRVEPAVLSVLGMLATIAVVTAVLIRFRRRWVTMLSWYAANTLYAFVDRVAPAHSGHLAPALLAARGRRFAAGFGSLTDRPRVLGRTIATLVLAWTALGLALLVSFAALGSGLPIGVALLVPQIAGLAGIIPLPGGLGSIDATLVALLLSLTQQPFDTVGAAVLVFRTATYWWGLLVSGLVVLGLGIRIRALE
jgi:hypothetical protein